MVRGEEHGEFVDDLLSILAWQDERAHGEEVGKRGKTHQDMHEELNDLILGRYANREHHQVASGKVEDGEEKFTLFLFQVREEMGKPAVLYSSFGLGQKDSPCPS